MNRKLHIFILLLITSLLLCIAPGAWGETGEYQVKAAYLYQLAKFVEWPSDAAPNTSPILNICIIGKSPFKEALNNISGKTVRNRRVVISYIKRIEELKECDILFVSMSEKTSLANILASVASRPILTVSDIRRFAAAEGQIGFVVAGDKVRFEINQRATRQAGLRVSAQLLKLATEVLE